MDELFHYYDHCFRAELGLVLLSKIAVVETVKVTKRRLKDFSFKLMSAEKYSFGNLLQK